MKFALVSMLFLASCAGYQGYKTFNQTTLGEVTIRGGLYQKEKWSDELVFHRMSWYHGMTLYYDTLLYKADINSPFMKWFSPSEKEYFAKCESLIVSVNYSADPSKISHVTFREQMKLNGYDDVVLTNFSSYLKTHPAAQDWRFFNYRILGYCKRSPSRLGTSKLAINFPSFRHIEVNL